MNEMPIVLSQVEVLAIIAGRKAQARHPASSASRPLDFLGGRGDEDNPAFWGYQCETGSMVLRDEGDADTQEIPCPFGTAGGFLWVRETLRRNEQGIWRYAADDALVILDKGDPRAADMAAWSHHKDGDVCASNHMPRWACRFVLEVVQVRIERLQSISEADARAEGIEQYKGPLRWVRYLDPITGAADHVTAVDAYRSLWTSRHASAPWARNPWVWIAEFKRFSALASAA